MNGADTLQKPHHKVTVEKMRGIRYSTRNCDPKKRHQATALAPLAAFRLQHVRLKAKVAVFEAPALPAALRIWPRM